MRFGIMDAVLGGTTSEAIARAKKLGADGIEINLQIAKLKNTPDLYRTIGDEAKRAGLVVPSAVLGEHNSGGIATWWRGADADEEAKLALDATKAIGAATLLLPFFFFNEPKGKSHRDAVVERLKPLAAHAASLGVVLAFEGVIRAEHLAEMGAQINSPGFGVYYDPANMTWVEADPPAEIRLLGKLLRQAHAKEAKVFTGDAHLGQGKVDHRAVSQAMRDVGYGRWIVLETPGGTDAEIASDLKFAREVYG